MKVWSLIYERDEIFELENGLKFKGNFEEIFKRYTGSYLYCVPVMESIWVQNFFSVSDRDFMYNEMVNNGFKCFKVESPQMTNETIESVRKKGELQKKKAEKELKKLRRIAKRLGEEIDI